MSERALVDDLRRVAREDFGWDRLKPGQLEAMTAILDGRDVVAAMPTGYGKSAIYQVTAALREGMTLVISPLIALEHDQVAAIEAADDAPAALAVDSTLSARRTEEAWQTVEAAGVEYLFLSPEQLANEATLERLADADADVSLVVVDEAHCISAWGHDFRPDYLRLGAAIERLGHPPVLALTATASPPVREEIVTQLHMRDPRLVVGGFDRPNIRLDVRRATTADDKKQALLDVLPQLSGIGLVYVSTRAATHDYAELIGETGLRTAAYHGGMRAKERARVHEGFLDDCFDVVVATSAFGLGIDKPDVRFVLHESVPDSLDDYYQQIGRAGRDGDDAHAVLFYRPEDLALRTFFAASAPPEDTLRTVFGAVPKEPISLRELRTRTGLKPRTVTNAVNLLARADAIHDGSAGIVTTGVGIEAAVTAALHVATVDQRMDESRVEMMRGYAETRDCRRRFLLEYFGEHPDGPCGNCDRCDDNREDESSCAAKPSEPNPFPVDTRVEHRSWGRGVVIRAEADRITVLFDEHGYRTLSLDAIEEAGLVEPME